MAEINDIYGSVYQNLTDAGCDSQTIEGCMLMMKEEQYFTVLQILSQHRKSLLGSVHTGQKRIGCLDFLIYKIKKEFI